MSPANAFVNSAGSRTAGVDPLRDLLGPFEELVAGYTDPPRLAWNGEKFTDKPDEVDTGNDAHFEVETNAKKGTCTLTVTYNNSDPGVIGTTNWWAFISPFRRATTRRCRR